MGENLQFSTALFSAKISKSLLRYYPNKLLLQLLSFAVELILEILRFRGDLISQMAL